MKILFLDQFSSLGGGQQCLRELVAGLVAQGHTCHAGLPGNGPLAGHLTQAGATVHHIPLSSYTDGSKTAADVLRFAFDIPRLAQAIRRLVREESIDLVYVNGPRLLPAAALATDRIVFHSHSLLIAGYAKRLAGLALRARNVRVIASSHFVAEPLTTFVPPERLQVIYNGVADCSTPLVSRAAQDSPAIGIIGRVAPEKGHLDFLAAARHIRDASPGCRFVVCGDGQHSGDGFLERVRQAASGLQVEFVAWQQDVRAVLSRLDLLVVPSRSLDATPRVIPEALSAGVPVVAYRTGGIPELLGDQSDVLTPADDPVALGSRILEILSDREDLRERGRIARRTYLRRFTVDRYVQEIGTVLESELSRFSNNPRIMSPASSAPSPARARTTR